MARVFSCGFELNGGGEPCGFTGGAMVSTIKRSGTYAFRRNGAGGLSERATYRTAPTDERTFHRFWLYIDAAPSAAEAVYFFRSGGNARGSLRVNTDRTLVFYSAAGVEVGSTSAVLSLTTWYRIEIDFTASSTVTVEVKVDGTAFTSGTTYATTAGVDGADFGLTLSVTGDYYIDDWAINDTSGSAQTSYPGDGKICYLRPNGAGDADTGSPTRGGADSGTIQGQLDEITPNDATDYVVLPANPSDVWVDVEAGSAGGIGASDTITLVEVHGRVSAASSTTSNWFPQIKKASAGTITSASAVTWASASWFTNDDTAGDRGSKLTRYTDPDGAAWTPSTIDSMQISAKTTDGNPDTWVSAIWAIVEYVPASGDVTRTATTPVVTFTAPTATRVAGAITRTAGAPVVTLSAPSASRVATMIRTAGAPVVTLSAPSASRVVGGVTRTAGAPLVTVTAPSATRIATMNRTAGAPVLTLTAPSATRTATVTRTAGAPLVTFTAPGATRTAVITRTANAPVVTVTAPTATAVDGGSGGTTLAANAPVVTFTAPSATRTATMVRLATAPAVTLTAPSATGVPGATTIAATAPLVTFSAPPATGEMTGGFIGDWMALHQWWYLNKKGQHTT